MANGTASRGFFHARPGSIIAGVTDSAPTPPEETPRQTLGRFLLFLGPIVTMGGALAVMRLGRVGERSVFFAAFLPAGLVIWYVGWRLAQRR